MCGLARTGCRVMVERSSRHVFSVNWALLVTGGGVQFCISTRCVCGVTLPPGPTHQPQVRSTTTYSSPILMTENSYLLFHLILSTAVRATVGCRRRWAIPLACRCAEHGGNCGRRTCAACARPRRRPPRPRPELTPNQTTGQRPPSRCIPAMSSGSVMLPLES